jgi:hypothetical protein
MGLLEPACEPTVYHADLYALDADGAGGTEAAGGTEWPTFRYDSANTGNPGS